MTDDPRTYPAAPGMLKVHAVLVTFRRTHCLAEMLERLRTQSLELDTLIVVDNAPCEENRELVQRHAELGFRSEYVASPHNLGPAGGLAQGMTRILRAATDADWILCLDDDDPPNDPGLFGQLAAFADRMQSTSSHRIGGVGRSGVRLDRRRGTLVRLPDEELKGPVPVDYIGGNAFPMYSVAAVRAVGVPNARLFFGFDDLEFGLRLKRGGHALYSHGELHRQGRIASGRLNVVASPSRGLSGPPSWRRYYSLRNLIWIYGQHGLPRVAARVALTGLVKPLLNVPLHPIWACRHLALNARAIRDGYAARLGLTIKPVPKGS